jgi:hypothetical protein
LGNGVERCLVPAAFHGRTMLPIPQMRKPFIKEGLIPTILNIGIRKAQKKSRMSGS